MTALLRLCFFFSSRRRHTRFDCDWSSDVCSSDLPKVDLQVSATFQSRQGAQLAANFNASKGSVAQSLGRDLAGGAANVTVNLVTPGALLGDRINNLDFRVAKILKFGRTRSQVTVDIY